MNKDMVSEKNKQNLIFQIVTGVILLVLVGFVFFMQTRFSFVLEDMDYMKNLTTGKVNGSLGDIIKGIPALMKNGGSVLSLTILQTVLLMGEKIANIFNVLVILAIAYLMSRCSGARKGNLLFIALPFFLLLSLNSDWKYSYLWEFGLINYVLPAIPFLIFLYMVIYELAFSGKNSKAGLVRAVLGGLCAFVCAWQNAGFGVLCVCICALSIILSFKVLGIAGKTWLWISGGCSLAGMLFYILVSGNFKHESVMNGEYISFSIFPAVVLALLILAVVLRCGGWLNVVHLLLIGVLCCCVALRFIMGWLPGISVNGIQIATLIVSIVLFCSLMRSFLSEYKKVAVWGYMLALCSFLYMVMTILEDIGGIS